MTDSRQIRVQPEKGGAVMYLPGRVSIETSPDFRDHLLNAAQAGQKELGATTLTAQTSREFAENAKYPFFVYDPV